MVARGRYMVRVGFRVGDITAYLCTDGIGNRREKADEAGKKGDSTRTKSLVIQWGWNLGDT